MRVSLYRHQPKKNSPELSSASFKCTTRFLFITMTARRDKLTTPGARRCAREHVRKDNSAQTAAQNRECKQQTPAAASFASSRPISSAASNGVEECAKRECILVCGVLCSVPSLSAAPQSRRERETASVRYVSLQVQSGRGETTQTGKGNTTKGKDIRRSTKTTHSKNGGLSNAGHHGLRE